MIRLPTFTFIHGPAGSGKSTLSNLIASQDSGLIQGSFAEPLRAALLAVFHPTEQLDNRMLDLRDEKVKKAPLPLCPNWSHRQFLIDFASFLRSKTNECFLGDLAKRNCERMMEYYHRFVFDDCRTIGDISPFINGYGAENCLLLRLERPGALPLAGDVGTDPATIDQLTTFPGVRHAAVSNSGSPEDMLIRLEAALGSSRQRVAAS